MNIISKQDNYFIQDTIHFNLDENKPIENQVGFELNFYANQTQKYKNRAVLYSRVIILNQENEPDLIEILKLQYEIIGLAEALKITEYSKGVK